VFLTCTTALIDLLAAKVKSGSDDVGLIFLGLDSALSEY
jgi:aryl carrier-like protein